MERSNDTEERVQAKIVLLRGALLDLAIYVNTSSDEVVSIQWEQVQADINEFTRAMEQL